MSKQVTKKNGRLTIVDNYPRLLTDIKQRIRTAQVRTAMAGNASLLMLYWEIGGVLAARQNTEGWGAAVLPKLAIDLHSDLPEVHGFSERNMRRMIQFHQEYPGLFSIWPRPVAKSQGHSETTSIRPRPVAQLAARPSRGKKGPPAVAQLPSAPAESTLLRAITQIPWAHNVILIQMVKDLDARLWYARKAFEHGWSRDVLSLQIQSRVHERQGKAITNFQRTLPPPQSDLAAQLLKDPYLFDFLTLERPFHERELETGLLRHLQDFLVELGTGFAYVGRQVHLDIGDDDFYVDLLFYHLRLRCFVVIDLKVGRFKAEYAGKMNFYLNVVDDRLKHATDQPSIGLILCEDKNKIVAEYALRGMDKAIGVSAYQLTRALPKRLQSLLPSVAQLEKELSQAKPAQPAPAAQRRKRK
jgi:predicted nuclease of restriction endonuclease-like (RecB) superfamily